MKATIHFWCLPKKAKAPYDAEDIQLTLNLPFEPQPGMDLKVTDEGTFHRVDGVMWDASEPDEVHVYLEEPEDDDLQPWKAMREQGWGLS